MTDPAVNLAIEEFAVRNFEISENYCFLYNNESSVIVGKNQNVFEEINNKFVFKNRLPVYRRISGGGTVFHDINNLNFSFITKFDSHKFNKYKQFTNPIIKALNDMQIPAYLNERNDIFVGDKKISGNAQFTSRDRMISHGTLLFNADLSRLRDALRSNPEKYESKSSKSFRSSVANIAGFLSAEMSMVEFKQKIKKTIAADSCYFAEYYFSKKEWNEINKLADDKYRSFEWNIGRSPGFIFRNKIIVNNEAVHSEITVKNGLIKKMQLISDYEILNKFPVLLEGCRYDWETLRAILINEVNENIPDETLFELLFG